MRSNTSRSSWRVRDRLTCGCFSAQRVAARCASRRARRAAARAARGRAGPCRAAVARRSGGFARIEAARRTASRARAASAESCSALGSPLLGPECASSSATSTPSDHLEDLVVHVLARQHVAPLAVERLALLVHHVVVVEQVLADVEVARLDLLLRVLDRRVDHAMLDRLALLEAQALHPRRDAIAAEDAHQVVFERRGRTASEPGSP